MKLANTLDNALYEIHMKVWSKAGSKAEADAALMPLEWYTRTGRASWEFVDKIRNTTTRQKSAVANRLMKHSRGDYEAAIDSVCQYLGYRRETV